MEYKMAQRRMLICAALFSFGTLSGALTLSELSGERADSLTAWVMSAVSLHPYLLILGAFALGPLLLIVFGLSPTGTFFVSLTMAACGVAAGAVEALSIRCGFFAPIPAACILPYALCLIMIGSVMLRTSSLIRAQIRSGGRLRPDLLRDTPRVLLALTALLMSAFCLAAYLLRA